MLNQQSLFKNLALAKTVYPHSIIRQKKKKIGQLDYSFNVCKQKLEYLTQYQKGEKVNNSLRLLSNKNNKAIKIQTFVNHKILNKNTEYLTFLNEILKKFQNNNSKKLAQIIAPTKGGFLIYYSGLVGILPQKYLKKILLNSIKIQQINLATNLFISQIHKNNSILTSRTNLYLENLKVQLNILNVNLASLENIKYFTNFTFIFKLKKY